MKSLKKMAIGGARKLWNENTVEIQGDGYWLSLNPILDLQVGKASGSDVLYLCQHSSD
jgi:hypothetical protein